MKWISTNERMPEENQHILIKVARLDGIPDRIVSGKYYAETFWADPTPHDTEAFHSYSYFAIHKGILGWAPIEALDEIEVEGTANEMKASFYDRELNKYDRALFVKNLGKLLAQTCTGVYGCELDPDADTVTITYDNGYQKKVDVACDSYKGIIHDVTRAV